MNLREKENLVFQSYCLINFIEELNNLDFVNSDVYKNLNFQDKVFQKYFGKGLPLLNRGTFVVYFYVLLVIPQQLIFDEFSEDFKSIGNWVKAVAKRIEHKENKVDVVLADEYVIRKIRNSISHATVNFHDIDLTIEFSDRLPGTKYQTSIFFPMDAIPALIDKLRFVILKYVEKIKS